MNCLLGEKGGWNDALIQACFLPKDVEDILQTPLPRHRRDNEIIWAANKKGVFSIKSAYFINVN